MDEQGPERIYEALSEVSQEVRDHKAAVEQSWQTHRATVNAAIGLLSSELVRLQHIFDQFVSERKAERAADEEARRKEREAAAELRKADEEARRKEREAAAELRKADEEARRKEREADEAARTLYRKRADRFNWGIIAGIAVLVLVNLLVLVFFIGRAMGGS